MDIITKENLLKEKAVIEGLINLNHKYYDKDKINGLEFIKYITKLQENYREKVLEEEIKLYTLLPEEFNLISTNKLIKDLNMPNECFINFKNSLGLIPLGDEKKVQGFIAKYGYDIYYKLMIATRKLDEYAKEKGLIFPSRIIHPNNFNISIGLSDDSFTILENIDKEKIKYTNTLGNEDWTLINSSYEEIPLFIDSNIAKLYLKSICLDNEALPNKLVTDIKNLRLKKN